MTEQQVKNLITQHQHSIRMWEDKLSKFATKNAHYDKKVTDKIIFRKSEIESLMKLYPEYFL